MGESRGYHHGNLKEIAVSVAYDLQKNRDSGIVGLREVARELGVTHGALNRHFQNKRGFLLVLATYCHRELATTLKASVDFDEEPAVQLADLATSFLSYAYDHPGCLVLLLADEIVSSDDQAFLESYHASLAVLFGIVEQGQKDRSLVGENPDDIAYLIWTFCLGYWQNCQARRRFDGTVPTAEASWPNVSKHFRRLLYIIIDGLIRR